MDSQYISNSSRSQNPKWVCPSDRQLALRAKLKTGWSVKSLTLDGGYNDYACHSSCPSLNNGSQKSSTALTSEEQKRIIEVIKRAEVLDLSEQERVGKLVERLDNMKRNVTVVNTRSSDKSCGNRCIRSKRCVCSCALCGEKFTVLGGGSILCKDCCKYVCKKCGVETTISTVVINNKSRIKNKQFFTASSISDISMIETENDEPIKVSTKIFLCRICTETREMWKKSGAWFFKSLPKYILPEKKVSKTQSEIKSTCKILSNSTELIEQDSSSDEDSTQPNLFLSHSLSSNLPDLSRSQNFDTKIDIEIQRKSATALTEIDRMKSSSPHKLQFHLSPHNQLNEPSISSSSTLLSSPVSSASLLSLTKSTNRLSKQKEKSLSSSKNSIFYTNLSSNSSESIDSESLYKNDISSKSPVNSKKSKKKSNRRKFFNDKKDLSD
ncbi:GSCOCG00004347001-RA-CDS [Cotesia congregata]|nr:GSCOCG00004347001-RA-CDS [Cotesia congregata]